MDSEMLKITRLGRRDTRKILKKTRIVLRGLIESFEGFLVWMILYDKEFSLYFPGIDLCI